MIPGSLTPASFDKLTTLSVSKGSPARGEGVSSIDNPVSGPGPWLAMTRSKGLSASYRWIREI